jgi:multidrug efflux pump
LAILLIFFGFGCTIREFQRSVGDHVVCSFSCFWSDAVYVDVWCYDDIYSQIGIIMLIGLVAKNGILIVEFANQRQESGLSKYEAVMGASVQRLRPILMTSISNHSRNFTLAFARARVLMVVLQWGTAVVGGLLIATLLTLFLVPAIYMYLLLTEKYVTKKKLTYRWR